MSILDRLASSLGERRQDANCAVAEGCVADPGLLAEIVDGLRSPDARLAGDCAEVMTKVAEVSPQLVAPFAAQLAEMLAHKNGRVRWESMHAFALVSGLVPDRVAERLEWLQDLIRGDRSVIVRDYAIDAAAGYGGTSPDAAKRAAPILEDATVVWNGKHAARALAGLARAAGVDREVAATARDEAERFRNHERSSIRKAARATLRSLNSESP